MNRTKIEWVKNPDGSQGYTLNPVTGCLNHTSEGLCLGGLFPCYAYRLASGRLKQRYLANLNIAPRMEKDDTRLVYLGEYENPFYPRFWPERLEEPLARIQITKYGLRYWANKPKGIFVCDMGELFGDWLPREWQESVFEVIHNCPDHRFYLLTKQPQNLIKFNPFPDNCWVGVTVTNEGKTYPDMFEIACRALGEIKAPIKYVSFEPLQSSIYKLDLLKIWSINWLIIGAQTNPYKPPKIEWVEEIVRVADKVGIPIFLKDNLKSLLGNNLRQEVPK